MSFGIVPGILASAVATNGTFTGSYPTGFTEGDFAAQTGLRHKLSAGQTVYSSPGDFTVAFATSAWTVTWKAANTLPANLAFKLQLDQIGSVLNQNDIVGVNRAHLARLVQVRLGNPIATSAVNIRASAAAAGVTPYVLLITTLDVPRNIIFTSTGDDSGITATIVGKDEYGVSMTETVTLSNASVAAGKKAFKTLTSITPSGSAATAISVGIGNVLGLPVYLPNAACILKEIQDNASASAGTTVVGLSTATKPTATTADVRGTYVPNSAPDGTKAYMLTLALPDPSFLGSPQF